MDTIVERLREDFTLLFVFQSLIAVYILVQILSLTILGFQQKLHKLPENRVLVFIAHPDDEVMFFGPSIVGMLRDGVHLYIICLSDGNFEGMGKVRQEELWASTGKMGLDPSHVILSKSGDMPDDPETEWSVNSLGARVVKFIETYEAKAIVTFDSGGVSGHANHKSLGRTVHHLISNRLLPSYCSAYSLQTVPLWRKYSFIFDLTPTLLHSYYVYLSWPSDYLTLVSAMCLHKSQLVWFRKLYIIFSRYMYVNSFKKMS